MDGDRRGKGEREKGMERGSNSTHEVIMLLCDVRVGLWVDGGAEPDGQ